MARRLLGLALAFMTVPLIAGCLIGPEDKNERLLVEKNWKQRRQRPIIIDPDYVYPGERFEEAYVPDDAAR